MMIQQQQEKKEFGQQQQPETSEAKMERPAPSRPKQNCCQTLALKLKRTFVQQKDYNVITLRIREKALREQFESEQVALVQRRWNIIALSILVITLVSTVARVNQVHDMLSYFLRMGDVCAVGIVMGALGLCRSGVHHYSLSVLTLVHCISSCYQTVCLVQKQALIADYTDIFSTTQMMLRQGVPASLLFMTSFRQYLFVTFPLIVVSQSFMVVITEAEFQRSANNCADSIMPKDYSAKKQLFRDIFLFLCVTAGIYSHYSTLVSKFILNQKITRQQEQLVRVFHEQPDGLLVLKKRAATDDDTEGGSEEAKSKPSELAHSALDHLKRHLNYSVQEENVENKAIANDLEAQPEPSFKSSNAQSGPAEGALGNQLKLADYEVKFKNRAIEGILGCEDLQKCLSVQSLMIDGQLRTLNQITKLANSELNRFDAQVVSCADNFHNIQNMGQAQTQDNRPGSSDGWNQRAGTGQKWVNMRRQNIVFDGEKCLLLSMRDVTAQHVLKQNQSELESLKKLHIIIQNDLEEPLNQIIIGIKHLIRWHQEMQKAAQVDTSASELLSRVLVAAKMSLFRCRDLLELNTSGKNKKQTCFKLYKATDSITKIIELLHREKRVKVVVKYEDEGLAKAMFEGDVVKYQQVLINLLSNAARTNPPLSKVVVRISFMPLKKVKSDGSQKCLLSVEVHDDGRGITEEDQQRLFAPFMEVKTGAKNGKASSKRVCIGLFASKVICEKMGGDIDCFSHGLNHGSIFNFSMRMTLLNKHSSGKSSSQYRSVQMTASSQYRYLQRR